MNLVRSVFIFLVLFLISMPVLSADDDFKNAHGDFFKLYSPERTDLRFGYLYEMQGQEDKGPGEFDLHNSFADFTLQMPLGENAFFSLGGEFELRRYLFELVDGASTRAGSQNLYGVSVNPGFGFFLTDDILLWGQSTLGNYSDLDGGFTDLDNYQLLGKVSLVFRINPGAQVVVGATYSNDYLDNRFLPFLGLRLMSDTGKFSLSLDLPFHVRGGYYLTPEIETFAQVVVSGDRYKASINGEDLDIGVYDERAGMGLRFWLFDKVSLTFEGGRTLGSELRFNDYRAGQFTSDDIEPHWYGRSYLGFPL